MGNGKQDDDGPKISPEEAARIKRAAYQLASYANFLRWSANFQKDEVTRHPRHDRVMMLSPMQSARFAFAIEGDTLLLGVQPFEAIWVATMPFDRAYVSDRLYLSGDGVACMDNKLPPLGLGFFIDDQAKRKAMSEAKWLQPVRMRMQGGHVAAIDGAFGKRIPLSGTDIIKALGDVAAAKLKQQDMSRFY